MKVKCINNECISKDLELGKIYDVVEEIRNYYAIEVKQGVVVHFAKELFKVVEGKDDMIVRCIEELKLVGVISLYNEYNVLTETQFNYTIVTDDNKIATYPKFLFEVVCERGTKMSKDIKPKRNIRRLQEKIERYENRNRKKMIAVNDIIVLKGDAIEVAICIPTLKAIGINTRIVENHISNIATLGMKAIRQKWNYRIEDGIMYYCNKSGTKENYELITYSETNLSTFLEIDTKDIEERITTGVIASILQEEIDKTCENMEDSCNFEEESTEYVRCMEMLKKRCLEEKHEHSKKNDKILDRLKSKFGSSIK